MHWYVILIMCNILMYSAMKGLNHIEHINNVIYILPLTAKYLCNAIFWLCITLLMKSDFSWLVWFTMKYPVLLWFTVQCVHHLYDKLPVYRWSFYLYPFPCTKVNVSNDYWSLSKHCHQCNVLQAVPLPPLLWCTATDTAPNGVR